MFWIYSNIYDKDFLVYSVAPSDDYNFAKFLIYRDGCWEWITNAWTRPSN